MNILDNLTFDMISGMVAILILTIVCIVNRDKLEIQPMLGYLLYIIMYPTRRGIKLMDKIATRWREWVKLYGYISIGLGFMFMVLFTAMIILVVIKWVVQPVPDEPGFALVIPFTNIPGVGYLSFWYFFISIFILAIIHEGAHGTVARAHGLEIKRTGFAFFGLILPIFPAAFVEPDEKKLQKKDDTVQYSIFAAGPMINILLAIILLILMPYVGQGVLYPGSGPNAPFEDSFSEPIGFSYNLVQNESLPASQVGMPNHSIITSINNKSVKTYNDFATEIMYVRAGENVTIGTKNGTFTLETIEHPRFENRAYIGIYQDTNEKRKISELAQWKFQTYYWFKGLFKWLFTLNLFVGLANLLPMGPVDGGRMFGLALKRLMKNQKRAEKIWLYIGILFLLIIIFGLIVNYLGNPFLLFK
ncbi:MAG: site-2 protease family protein [Candidatus Nanoarchaeia archaeon]